jgi:hypothetical protein
LKSKQLVFRDEAGADPVALYTYIAQASGSFHTAFSFTERLRSAWTWEMELRPWVEKF